MKRNKKVLIIDDEANIRINFKRFFEKFSINVDTAGSAAEALKFCDKNNYALILLDINLSDMNGIELLKMIKKQYLSTNVVMLTGLPSLDKELLAAENGAVGFMRKPFDLQKLKDIINNIL